jgi:hypothetical protein
MTRDYSTCCATGRRIMLRGGHILVDNPAMLYGL